jgi:quercetin dioxygenase-like cupin family protein
VKLANTNLELPVATNADDLRAKVTALQQAISGFPQYEPETVHLLHGGMYCRQVWRPAGCLIVGKVHKKEHFYMVAYGTVQVTTDSGVETIVGPRVICTKPGTKRAVFAETDALCMTFHRVESDSMEEIEEELIEPDPTSLLDHNNKVKKLVESAVNQNEVLL